MKITVIGKSHHEGVSKKSNASYNFNKVYYNAPDKGVEGLASMALTLDPPLIDYAAIQVGGVYEAEYGPFNRVVGFRLCPPVK
jgi:hypothetical protein